jgi:CelD/BcsL family acetyltransferase involved in cellulose biosynthesis
MLWRADRPAGERQAAGIRMIRDLAGLDRLAGVWDSMAEPSGSPTQRFAWVRACAATFTGLNRLHVVVMDSDAGAGAAAPLIERADGGRHLELLGAEELGEPVDVPARDSASLDRLAETLARSSRPLLLRRVPAGSPVVGAVQRAYRRRGVVICRPTTGSLWIPLRAGWVQPEDLLDAGRLTDVSRARRAAEGMGGMRHEVLSPQPADLGPLLDQAWQVETAGRTGGHGSGDPLRGRFFRRYAEAACRDGMLRLAFLRIGGRPAAMQLAVECGGRFWLLKIGCDEQFARCSPGSLLMLETLRYAAARGLRSYELPGSPEPWTKMWTPLTRQCVSVRAYPTTEPGLSGLVMDLAKRAGRRAIAPAALEQGVAALVANGLATAR